MSSSSWGHQVLARPSSLSKIEIERARAIPRSKALERVIREKSKSCQVFIVTYDPRLLSINTIVRRHWRTMTQEHLGTAQQDLVGRQISCTLLQDKLHLHQEFVENLCLNSSYLVGVNRTWQVWGDSTERPQVCFQTLCLRGNLSRSMIKSG